MAGKYKWDPPAWKQFRKVLEGLEASNKELRRGKAQFSRKDDLSHGLRDCWKRQFIKSDGIVNNFKKEILCTNCGDKTHFIRKCPELKSKDEEETLNEDEELIESFFLDDWVVSISFWQFRKKSVKKLFDL